ncbi:MAG: Alkaline phosphatase [Thermoleophilia bacterium]|nr:Alkaline phosphatase [Thermoleophilia bacterium]
MRQGRQPLIWLHPRRAHAVGVTLAAAVLLNACATGPSAADRGDPPPKTKTSTTTAAKDSHQVPTIVAAGDIACEPGSPVHDDQCRQADTARLAQDLHPEAILALGDLQYNEGNISDFNESFDHSWGALKDRIRPVPGNHEYRTPDAGGYFEYFGRTAGKPGAGYYSFDLGRWHLIALNSNCGELDVCGEDSDQVRWLRRDLAKHPTACALAFWHHPRFSSGRRHGGDDSVSTLWRTLDDAGVDVVLTGHEHNYERFAPQDADGQERQDGMREFVVGTGGSEFYGFGRAEPHSQARGSDSFGLLTLALRPDDYEWQFISIPSSSPYEDYGTATCE